PSPASILSERCEGAKVRFVSQNSLLYPELYQWPGKPSYSWGRLPDKSPSEPVESWLRAFQCDVRPGSNCLPGEAHWDWPAQYPQMQGLSFFWPGKGGLHHRTTSEPSNR